MIAGDQLGITGNIPSSDKPLRWICLLSLFPAIVLFPICDSLAPVGRALQYLGFVPVSHPQSHPSRVKLRRLQCPRFWSRVIHFWLITLLTSDDIAWSFGNVFCLPAFLSKCSGQATRQLPSVMAGRVALYYGIDASHHVQSKFCRILVLASVSLHHCACHL